MTGAQDLGRHVIILGEPDLQLLVPPPVSSVPARRQWGSASVLRNEEHSQLSSRHLLLDVEWTAVEDPEQRFLVEVLDLALDGLDIRHVIAVW